MKTLKRNKYEAKLKKFKCFSEQDAMDKLDDYKGHHEDDYAKAEQKKADAQMSQAEHALNQDYEYISAVKNNAVIGTRLEEIAKQDPAVKNNIPMEIM